MEKGKEALHMRRNKLQKGKGNLKKNCELENNSQEAEKKKRTFKSTSY